MASLVRAGLLHRGFSATAAQPTAVDKKIVGE